MTIGTATTADPAAAVAILARRILASPEDGPALAADLAAARRAAAAARAAGPRRIACIGSTVDGADRFAAAIHRFAPDLAMPRAIVAPRGRRDTLLAATAAPIDHLILASTGPDLVRFGLAAALLWGTRLHLAKGWHDALDKLPADGSAIAPLLATAPALPPDGQHFADPRLADLFDKAGGWRLDMRPPMPDPAAHAGHSAQDDRALLQRWAAMDDANRRAALATDGPRLREALARNNARRNADVPDIMRDHAVDGTLALWSGDLPAARRHWDAYWQQGLALEIDDSRRMRYSWYENRNPAIFEPLTPHDPPARRDGLRIVVYTALIGNYDDLHPPLHRPDGVDFVCFTDSQRPIPGWQTRPIPDTALDPIRQSRFFKILPHLHFPDHDASLYVDANVLFTGDLDRLFSRWLVGRRFVAWMHPVRSDILDEFNAILTSHRSPPAEVLRQAEALIAEGLPRHSGLIEACFLWRDHRDPALRALMEAWWEHFLRFGRRDQPGLSLHMARTGLRAQVLPPALGTSRQNDFAIRTLHRTSAQSVAAAPGSAAATLAPAPDRRLPRAPRSGPARHRPLVWLVRAALADRASTRMRAYQLSDLVNRERGLDTRVLDETALPDLRDATVILAKSFLQGTSHAEIDRLKDQGNLVCADWVDMAERPELVPRFDLHVASSIGQFAHFAELRQPVALVTHHTDPRIGDRRSLTGFCNIAYFGELSNALYPDRLHGKVDFNRINTKTQDRWSEHWLHKLTLANVHYAVRETRTVEGFKPFLKGFTAARLGANIIVSQGDGDARFYLGSEYPYLLRTEALPEVEAMIEFVHESFGGPEWRFGLEIMTSVRARSTDAAVAAEVAALQAMLSA